MTVEEYVLLYSTLVKNGTHTMLEHLQHMAISVTGECIAIVAREEDQYTRIDLTDVDIVIEEVDEITTIINDDSIVITVDESTIGVN